jgi:HK97 family phage prohead protease
MSMDRDLDELVVMEAEARTPLELRAAQTVEVQRPQRIVTVLVAPYEEPTPILRQNEWIVETIARGAYEGIEPRARRVKVNRDHQLDKTCGRAIALYPSRQEGLVAELRISETPLGDESLALAADGVLDASAGFRPIQQSWNPQRTERRVERAWLSHIALVPDPAYDAPVLDVRSSTGALAQPLSEEAMGTPRLDAVLARLAEMGYHPRPK